MVVLPVVFRSLVFFVFSCFHLHSFILVIVISLVISLVPHSGMLIRGLWLLSPTNLRQLPLPPALFVFFPSGTNGPHDVSLNDYTHDLHSFLNFIFVILYFSQSIISTSSDFLFFITLQFALQSYSHAPRIRAWTLTNTTVTRMHTL